ncbi:transposase (plasmid) [Arsenophonus nasoniae]|uniref:Transposase n=1 Tax=Arsenophonus nasoniae TaxID=638 RepID=A0ABY8NUZ3_9GAMM|nr:transposase [Arsenophonus nasoniae]WGM08237.1 transposase [Arsenophonus nasoniae]
MLSTSVATLNAHRYLASKLRHYRGGAVVHHYHDHRTGQHRQQTLPQEEMIRRYISHIPARHFKMVRYSGFCRIVNGENYCRKCIRHLR